jgi:parallel beta-helix repeat protein
MLLSNNTCTFNHYNGIAILLDGWGCDILDNNCSYNGGNGLSYSDCSSSNTISGNDFSHNARHGITAWLSNNCVITENTCSYNEGSGINLVDCGGYSITHNLFSFNNDSEMNLSNQMVVVGPWFDYTLSVSGDIAIGSYSFNDTVHFQIDSTGKIANITTLSVDTYGLAIHVIDTSGNEVVGAMVVYYDGVNDPFGTPNLLPGFRIDSLLSCFGVSVLILRMILNKQRFEIKHPPNV